MFVKSCFLLKSVLKQIQILKAESSLLQKIKMEKSCFIKQKIA